MTTISPTGDDVAHQGRIEAHAPKPMGDDPENYWGTVHIPRASESYGQNHMAIVGMEIIWKYLQ